MKTLERMIMKIVFIQFGFLLMGQLLFHHWNMFPEWKQLAEYEGVSESNYEKVLETFEGTKR